MARSFVRNSDLTRTMVSLAGDVRPFDRTVVEAFYSHYNLEQRGFPGLVHLRACEQDQPRSSWCLKTRPIPHARDTGSPRPAWTSSRASAQGRVKHDLNRNWRLSVGALDQLVERDISTQVNALTDNAGNYTASLASGFAPRFRVFSNLSHVNGRVTTGRITHDVAIGVAGYTFKTYSDVTNPPAASVRLGTANIASPVVFALPPAGIPTHANLFCPASFISRASASPTTSCWEAGGRCAPRSARTGSGPTTTTTAA